MHYLIPKRKSLFLAESDWTMDFIRSQNKYVVAASKKMFRLDLEKLRKEWKDDIKSLNLSKGRGSTAIFLKKRP